MKQTNHNKSFFIIAMGLRTVALLCVTGPIMQTFLASIGFSSQWIYIHTSIVQIINVMTISLCSTWADQGSVQSWFPMSTEDILLVFPEDIHMVKVMDGESVTVEKACFKVKA